MTDTVRTRAALLTLLADNTTGDISPQDLRDMLVSLHGNYGGLYIQDATTAQTGVTTAPVKMTGWEANFGASGVTPDFTNNQITVGSAGIYLIWFQASFSSSTGAIEFEARLRVNAVEMQEGFHTKTGGAADKISASFVGVELLAANDVLTIYIESDQAGGASFTPRDCQLIVLRIA